MLADLQLTLDGIAPTPAARKAAVACCPRCRRPLGAIAARRLAAPARDYAGEWDRELAAHPDDEAVIEAKVYELLAAAGGRPIGLAKVWESLRGKVAVNLDNSYRAAAARRMFKRHPDLVGRVRVRESAGDPGRCR